MRAAVCRAYGPPSSVEVVEVPVPEPGPGQVRVAVRAAAVNFPDNLLIAGRYQVRVEPPFVPGSEFAGVVEALGDGVAGLEPGEPVFGAVMTGAFAEKVVAPATSLQRIPEGLDFVSAAAFGVAYGTAYHALRSVAAPAPGEWVCVLGAAGGVGLASVDVAVVLGVRVVAVASSP
ncbi:MAG: NADPH:quinone oxidoreductase, partial [Acidimicrobiia bacterium]